MIPPIHRPQNVFTAVGSTSMVSTPNRYPSRIQDEMQIRASDQRSFLGSIWDSIVNCFKSIFRCFFSSPVDARTQIQEIAARDRFVWFYKQEENPLTAFMGNFHSCPVQVFGMRFQCAEAAFQAAKFKPHMALMQRFQNLDGEAAWRLGRQLALTNPPVAWHARSLNEMREVVHAKFSQNPALKELLLATGDAYLVEHIPVVSRDNFWGDNCDGTGHNWLGIIVMETRARLGGAPVTARNAQYNRFIAGH